MTKNIIKFFKLELWLKAANALSKSSTNKSSSRRNEDFTNSASSLSLPKVN
jgi:hypothetical protein